MGLLEQLFNLIGKVLCAPQKEQIEQQPQPQYPTQHQQQQNAWQQQGPPPQSQQHQHQQQQHTYSSQHQHHEQSASYPSQHQQKPHANYGKPFHHNDYMANAQNPTYVGLRADADKKGDEMGHLFKESHEAYEEDRKREAKELSDRAKERRASMERLNRQAADWIYEANNRQRTPEEVDLHGLRAEEAVEKTDKAVLVAKQAGLKELRIIVGKGIHSQNHKAVLKPKIEELMQKHNLAAEIDQDNTGVLIVHLDGRAPSGRGINPDEVTRRLDENEKGCIIM